MSPETINAISEWAKNLTLTGALVGLLLAIVYGYLITKGHHAEVIEQLTKERDRGWEEAKKAQEALSANNAVLDRVNTSLLEMTRTFTDFAARLPGRRS